MTIRTRLLILLLGTALVPLAITSLSHQISLHLARQRLTVNAHATLSENAQDTLLEELRGYVEVLIREKRLVQALLQRQAREIELALAQARADTEARPPAGSFGYDPQIELSTVQYHPCFQDGNDPNVGALQIDYQRQAYACAPWGDKGRVPGLIASLAPLTRVYHDLYQQAPDGTLWLSTRLDQGLYTRYPSAIIPEISRPPRPEQRDRRDRSGRPPQPEPRDADGRPPQPERREGDGRPPFRSQRMRPLRGLQREPLIVDPVTGQVTVLISVPLHDPNGTAIGATSLIRTIPEIFASLELPDLWGQDVERMLIRVDPNAPGPPSTQILLHDEQKAPVRRSRGRVRLQRLTSPDIDPFRDMIRDIDTGQPGVRTLHYQNQDYLWAYYPIDVQDVAVLLMVPTERVTALARRMEESLFRGGLTVLEITSGVFFVTAVVAVLLAMRRARLMTQPIAELIEAGQRLSRGDYEARAHIETGDELEQLGEVFNQTGPKLREHERMKSALELARAVQQSLLPKDTPAMQNFDIAGQCLFCDETGGDCYDFIDLSDVTPDRHGIVLGDVSGHGIGSALLMAAVRGSLQSEAKHHGQDLAELMAELNQQVVRDTETDKFVTLFYGILDGPARSLIWASAGHEPAVWYHQADRTLEELPNTGMPIGVHDAAQYEQAGPIILTAGDILIVGTDGIREARNAMGEELGRERLYAILAENADQEAAAISRAIVQGVLTFLDSAPRTDDITLVVIKAR
jgi:sigma-B regulation protein RsbU (phosphoserine phosphatase)